MTIPGFTQAQQMYDSQEPPPEREPPDDDAVRDAAYNLYIHGRAFYGREIDDLGEVAWDKKHSGYWVEALLWVPEDEV